MLKSCFIFFVIFILLISNSNQDTISVSKDKFNERENKINAFSSEEFQENNEISSESEGEKEKLKNYSPTWDSLDGRPLPNWYDEGKIGIFIHWGVFSVPSFGSEWFWNDWKTGNEQYVKFMKDNYPPKFTYQDFAHQFTAEFFNPDLWADLFSKAGARYVVLTSKHHEGFTLWPSKYSFSWNAMDVGPKRDLVGDLAKAVRTKPNLKFGLYHSLFEWFNPILANDAKNNFKTQDFVNFKTLPELYEIVNEYSPEVIWSDGDWEGNDTYWQAKEFLAWLYNDSPVKDTVVTNDRWGKGTACTHGGYYTCSDRYNPGVAQKHKWENCMTLDKGSWGFRRNSSIEQYLTPEELITTLVETISCGGNLLVNVGPTKEGTIAPIMQERLLQMGYWLDINGDAIYKSSPWKVTQNDTITPGVWYTFNPSENKLFAIATKGKPYQELNLGSVDFDSIAGIWLLGSDKLDIKWEKLSPKGTKIFVPSLDINESKWAWTFVIQLK